MRTVNLQPWSREDGGDGGGMGQKRKIRLIRAAVYIYSLLQLTPSTHSDTRAHERTVQSRKATRPSRTYSKTRSHRFFVFIVARRISCKPKQALWTIFMFTSPESFRALVFGRLAIFSRNCFLKEHAANSARRRP